MNALTTKELRRAIGELVELGYFEIMYVDGEARYGITDKGENYVESMGGILNEKRMMRQ